MRGGRYATSDDWSEYVETWREGAKKLEKSEDQQVGWLKENKQGGGSMFLTLV